MFNLNISASIESVPSDFVLLISECEMKINYEVKWNLHLMLKYFKQGSS